MKKNNGNALLLILIAIALFAALSYAVTQSGRDSGNIDREQVSIAAAEILQYASLVQQAVQTMHMFEGVELHQLDFRSDKRLRVNGNSAVHANTQCNTTRCQVFHPEGGGVPYLEFERYAATPAAGYGDAWERPGHHNTVILAIEGVRSQLPEIVLRFVVVDPEVCREINRQLGMPETPTVIITGDYSGMEGDPTAALVNPSAQRVGASEYDEVYGQSSFCTNYSSSSTFYHAVLTR